LNQPLVEQEEITDKELLDQLDDIEDEKEIDVNIFTNIPNTKIGEEKKEIKKTEEDLELERLENEISGL
jgi:ribosomal protein S3